MGFLKSFFMKYLLDGYTGRVERELDEIRSEVPQTLASGLIVWGAGVAPSASVAMSVPVVSYGGTVYSKAFHLRHIMIDNTDGSGQYAFFYDGPGYSVSVGGIQVNASTTEFVNGLKGWIFYSQVWASARTSITQIRVGGIVRDA